MWGIQMVVTVRSRPGTNHELSIDPTLNTSERGFPNFIMWIHSLVETILPISTFRWIITFCNSLDKFFGQNNPLIDQYLPCFCGGLPIKTCFLVPRSALGEDVGLHSFLEILRFFSIQLKPESFLKVWLLNLVEFCIQIYIIDFFGLRIPLKYCIRQYEFILW